MNLSAENIGKIRELVRSGYPLKARDAKDLLGHNDHLVELLEARGRLMLGVEIERDQLRSEVQRLTMAVGIQTVRSFAGQTDQKSIDELLAAGIQVDKEEIARLRAEVAGLRTGYEAYEQVNAELKAENEALRRERDARHPFKPFHEPAIGFTGCVICGVYTDHGGLPCPKTRATADAALGQGEQP